MPLESNEDNVVNLMSNDDYQVCDFVTWRAIQPPIVCRVCHNRHAIKACDFNDERERGCCTPDFVSCNRLVCIDCMHIELVVSYEGSRRINSLKSYACK